MTATTTAATTTSYPTYRMPFSSTLNRRLPNMMFSQATQPAEDSKPQLKPALKLLAAPTRTARHKPSNRVAAENRDGSDTEESACEEVFRTQRVWLNEDDELNSLWTLKRANPVLDPEEDVEETPCYESPSKRSRVQKLSWNDEVCLEGNSLLFACDEVFRSSS